MKDVTHWGKALEWLGKIGLNCWGEDEITYFDLKEPKKLKPPIYKISIPIDKYMDMYYEKRDAFENIAFNIKTKL